MTRTASRPVAGLERPAEVLPCPSTWWPYLTAGARRAILAEPDGPFPDRVRQEIERALGRRVCERARVLREDLRELAGIAG